MAKKKLRKRRENRRVPNIFGNSRFRGNRLKGTNWQLNGESSQQKGGKKKKEEKTLGKSNGAVRAQVDLLQRTHAISKSFKERARSRPGNRRGERSTGNDLGRRGTPRKKRRGGKLQKNPFGKLEV